MMGPLIFEPIYKPRLWGGQRLAQLSKMPPQGAVIGESWELADLESDQSVVRSGPLAGKTLHQLVSEYDRDLLGEVDLFGGRFPLLIKFLDAAQALSVQVHPNEDQARKFGGQVREKHEAWYIIDAAPDACIYHGLADGIDGPAFARAVAEGRTAEVLRRIPVKKGECYYLPSGTVHALGAGVLVAEVQTPSDVTYRVYDWDRVDPASGQPRALHLEQALECIDYHEAAPQQDRSHVVSVWSSVTRLVACESFVIEQIRMQAGVEQEVPHAGMVVWIILEGRGSLDSAGHDQRMEFGKGDTILLPAELDAVLQIHERAMWLEVSVPVKSDLTGFAKPAGLGRQVEDEGKGLLQVNLPPKERH